MPVITISQNILDLPLDIPLVHCVSRCFSMSAGLAKDVKQLFGDRSYLLDYPKPYIGGLGVTWKNEKLVIHLVTKRLYYHKPTWENLESCIHNLRNYCESFNISTISMPYFLACGLDRLHWPDVYNLISEVFQNSSITVYICKLR